ncbi:hypothetical protein AAH161_25145, partial [Bacteroides ovatus]|uniref:hypothetical protein n=1 Tax=Bacteroides ovatus TaxID=28116 RepID=UPI001E3A4BAF
RIQIKNISENYCQINGRSNGIAETLTRDRVRVTVYPHPTLTLTLTPVTMMNKRFESMGESARVKSISKLFLNL